MILSEILLFARILAVARPRPFIYTIGALGEIRALCGLNLSFFRACGLVQAAGGFFARFGWCVLNRHGFLHCGRSAARINERRMSKVPAGVAMVLGPLWPGKARAA
jgi:hypothetical protein